MLVRFRADETLAVRGLEFLSVHQPSGPNTMRPLTPWSELAKLQISSACLPVAVAIDAIEGLLGCLLLLVLLIRIIGIVSLLVPFLFILLVVAVFWDMNSVGCIENQIWAQRGRQTHFGGGGIFNEAGGLLLLRRWLQVNELGLWGRSFCLVVEYCALQPRFERRDAIEATSTAHDSCVWIRSRKARFSGPSCGDVSPLLVPERGSRHREVPGDNHRIPAALVF